MFESSAGLHTDWCVPASHPSLPGHFPGAPVVPAVVLLQAVADDLRKRLPDVRVIAISHAKFLQPILPDRSMQLRLSIDLPNATAGFRIECQGQLAAHGELGFSIASSGDSADQK